MPARKQRPGEIGAKEIESWYTAGEAAKRLAERSGRNVDTAYVSRLGRMGLIRTNKIHARLMLYSREDIDAYVVEPRGKKSGAAATERMKAKKHDVA